MRTFRALAVLVLAATGFGQAIQRVSVGSGGVEASGSSYGGSVSGDARYTAFESSANNLVSGDAGWSDIFVHDRFTGATARVSVGQQWQPANGHSHSPAMSGRGRFVAFESLASNLVSGDTPLTQDVFLYDQRTGVTQCASVGVAGLPGTNTGTHVEHPALSIDGRFVAFSSDRQDIVSGPHSGNDQVYVRDMLAGTTECISGTTSTGAGAPSISANGRYVAFSSDDPNIVPGDTAGDLDVFVRDRWTGSTVRISVGPNSASTGPVISYDGRFVVFVGITNSTGNAYYKVYLHDRLSGSTTPVSQRPGDPEPNGGSLYPCISPNARYVSYSTDASNVIPGSEWKVVRWDRINDNAVVVSSNASGSFGNADSFSRGVASTGIVAFDSLATNLIPSDTNSASDVFLKAP